MDIDGEEKTKKRANEHWNRASRETPKKAGDQAVEQDEAAGDLRAENLAMPTVIIPKEAEVPSPQEQVQGIFSPDLKSKPAQARQK